MNSVVVYASRSGNTRRIAIATAEALRLFGPCDLLAADAGSSRIPAGTDLLVVGGPTEGHGMTQPIKHFLDQLQVASLEGVAGAAFDTRLRWPKVLSGSAAEGIAARLESGGVTLVAPGESFMVTRAPVLEPGEELRAAAWAGTLAAAVADRQATAPTPTASAGRI